LANGTIVEEGMRPMKPLCGGDTVWIHVGFKQHGIRAAKVTEINQYSITAQDDDMVFRLTKRDYFADRIEAICFVRDQLERAIHNQEARLIKLYTLMSQLGADSAI
jgi:hypothetical protein